MTLTPRQFGVYVMNRWESSKHSTDKDDTGNTFKGKLVGSKYGVTGAALATHRKVADISFAQMAALTIEEAADIFLASYYYGPKLNLLPWDRVTASIVDFGWGAGPQQAIKLLQRMLDVDDDGKMGPMTASAYKALHTSYGANAEIFLSGAWWTIRDTFYELIIEKRATNAKYEKGWDNRSFDFTPRSDWWRAWG